MTDYLTPIQAEQLLNTENCILVDVRNDYEYNEEHLENAINLPLSQIDSQAGDILKDKDQCIVLYCRTGKRASMAAQLLEEMGYHNLKNIGGIYDLTNLKRAK